VRKLDGSVEERNYAKDPLTKPEIESIVDAIGVEAALNTRHATAKTEGWKTRAPSKAAFVKAALQDPNLLRRPILMSSDRKHAVVGQDEAGFKALLGKPSR
jgi:arsenate reductase-like glutaredoxin family protein